MISGLARSVVPGLALAGLLTATVLAAPQPAGAAAATTITLYAGGNNDQGRVFTSVLGVNHRYTFDGYETFDPATGRMKPDVVAKTERMGLKLVRWPGGTVANLTWWKGTVGDSRRCQRDGRVRNGDTDNRADPGDDVLAARHARYGLDEHMRFVEQIDAQAQIMTPMAIGNPIDAADLVEYLNTPAGDGVNPNGGTDWAEVRAANGHPKPYGVVRFELGNENYHSNQRYWMPQNDPNASPPARAAVDAYINGGNRTISGEALGKLRDASGDCTGSTRGVASDGTPNQVFDINYPSVVVNSFALRVGGVTWTRVDDLSGYGPSARVYRLRPHVGEVVFGDGVHGAIPPDGASVVADYTSTHRGFVDFRREMKEVDPSINVCAAWGKTDFPQLFNELAPAGSRYDCLTMHPYTNFTSEDKDDWDTAREAHDWHMISAWEERQNLVDLRNAVNANTGTPHPFVAVSEYGALWGPRQNNPFPEYNHAMTHALYMASQWIHMLELGIPWAEGNDFASRGWYTLLGPVDSGFVYSAEATAREAVKPMFEAKGQRIRHDVAGNPWRDPADATMCDGAGTPQDSCTKRYHKLNITATRAPDGAVFLMVVNRTPFATDDITADVVINGFTGTGSATVRQVAPSSFTSHNDVETPDAVTLSTSTRSVGASGFTATFPPFSVTLFQLPPA